jgi:hypothetical protein
MKPRPSPAGPFFPSPHCFRVEPNNGQVDTLPLFFAQPRKARRPGQPAWLVPTFISFPQLRRGPVASAERAVVIFPVETSPKNRGSSSPREEIFNESDQNEPPFESNNATRKSPGRARQGTQKPYK